MGYAAGAKVGTHDEVAVAAVPGSHAVALDSVHVDVDGQQVATALGSVVGDLIQEVAPVQAFALQPSLHVRHGHDHGVDAPRVDLGAQGAQVQGHSDGLSALDDVALGAFHTDALPGQVLLGLADVLGSPSSSTTIQPRWFSMAARRMFGITSKSVTMR